MSKDQKLVKIKRDTKSLVMKNLIVMAVLIIIALTGVISWFTNKTEATADGINVTCKAPDGLEVAIVPHGSKEKLEYQTGTIDLTKCKSLSNLFSNLSFEELTSDGLHFYKPKLNQSGSTVTVDTTDKWLDAEDYAYINHDDDTSIPYLSLDIYMRSENAHTIVLGSDTYIKPNSDKLNGADSGNKSELGDFSKDCIVGAVRMSTVVRKKTVVENETVVGNETKLWIPAPNILYNYDKGTVSTEIRDTNSESFKHKYWEVTDLQPSSNEQEAQDVIVNNNCDYKIGENDALNIKLSNDNIALSQDNDDKLFKGKFTLNIWIDGEDAEARQAMVGGKFTASIKLKISDK